MLLVSLARSTFVAGLLSYALLLGCQSHSATAAQAVAPTPHASTLAPGAIKRTLLEKHPLATLPGWETRLYLVEYGPAAVASLHVHPAVGIGYVLEGSFESAFGDEPPLQVHEGQAFADSAETPHRLFRNLSAEQPLRFVIAYTIRSDQEMFYPGATLPPRTTL